MDAQEIKIRMGSLYEESGGDTSRCEFCDELLTDDRPWHRGLHGAGAHEDCLKANGVEGPYRD